MSEATVLKVQAVANFNGADFVTAGTDDFGESSDTLSAGATRLRHKMVPPIRSTPPPPSKLTDADPLHRPVLRQLGNDRLDFLRA